MNFERFDGGLIYLNTKTLSYASILSENTLSEILELEKENINLEAITNISFFGTTNLEGYIKQHDKYINIIHLDVEVRIEYEGGESINSKIIELEKEDVVTGKVILSKTNLYINTVAVEIDNNQLMVSIVYSIYS